jgi:hypothetical protein
MRALAAQPVITIECSILALFLELERDRNDANREPGRLLKSPI